LASFSAFSQAVMLCEFAVMILSCQEPEIRERVPGTRESGLPASPIPGIRYLIPAT
jgi:hypothetical protein